MSEPRDDDNQPRSDEAGTERSAPVGSASWRDAGSFDAEAQAEEAVALAARLEHLARNPDVVSARAEVLAARANLVAERARLEASARAALDIPGRMRRAPAKTAGLAAGTAFLLFGGPGRVVRGIRRAILGPRADLPKSMLPDAIERELRKLGDDGKRVRAVLEREFARYLDEKADLRRERDLTGTLAALAGGLLKPASAQAGKRLAEQLFEPDGPGFTEVLRRAVERAERRGGVPDSPSFADAVRRARERADRQARDQGGGSSGP